MTTKDEKRNQRKAFGDAIRQARVALRSQEPKQSHKWTLDHVASESGVGCRASLHGIEDGTRHADEAERRALIHLLVAGLDGCANVDNIDTLKKNLLVFLNIDDLRLHEHRSRFDPDLYESLYDAWGRLLYRGDCPYVEHEARGYYLRLVEDPAIGRDFRKTLWAIRTACMLGRAQEIFSDDEWQTSAVTTYEDVEHHVLKLASEKLLNEPVIAHEYAYVYKTRGILYRKNGQYGKGLQDTIQALRYAKRSEDPSLTIDVYLQIAHLYACLGLEDGWKDAMELAMKQIDYCPLRSQMQFRAFLRYYTGEGIKRLAYDPYRTLSLSQRSRYAEHGAILLASARAELRDHPEWVLMHGFHPFYNRVAELQCDVWRKDVDLNEIRRELLELREQAIIRYPSVMGRIHCALDSITTLQTWNAHTPLPALKVDAVGQQKPTDAHKIRATLPQRFKVQ
jgi:tetratricopeptide (TPR) repeat protein